MTDREAPASPWFLVADHMPQDGECVYLWVEGPGKDSDNAHFEVVAWPYANGSRWAKAYGAEDLRAKPLMWRRPPTYQQTETALSVLRSKRIEP